eukprot:231614-Prymnesium_polylepis.1
MQLAWQDPTIAARLQSKELLPVRINTFAATDGLNGLSRSDARVVQLLQQHVASVRDTFNNTMLPSAYVIHNHEQWQSIHAHLLSHGTASTGALTYPFRGLLDGLAEEATWLVPESPHDSHSTSPGRVTASAPLSLAACSPAQRLST